MTPRADADRDDVLHPERQELQSEPERGAYERRSADPAGRPTPFVDGPTGPAAPADSEQEGTQTNTTFGTTPGEREGRAR
jgi:hypothetical protein